MLVGLEIFVAVGADFAIRAGLMRAAVSGQGLATLQRIISVACMMHRLTEQGYQTVKRPFGSAGRRMVVLEYGSSRV